jgi:hypothetical protein
MDREIRALMSEGRISVEELDRLIRARNAVVQSELQVERAASGSDEWRWLQAMRAYATAQAQLDQLAVALRRRVGRSRHGTST